MRLTPEVVQRSQSHLNPLKERELDLRGLQIPLIENLASHQGTYDTLNLTDNSLTILGNLPLSPRIRTIHVSNNNISAIALNFANSVPHLESLVLNNNSLATLSALLPLANLPKLTHLSLLGNPVRGEKYYREWVIWKVGGGNLHTLDFKRVKDAERANAKSLFEQPESKLPTKLALSLTSDAANNAALSAAASRGAGEVTGGKGRLLTPEEKEKVREAIKNASTVEEIRRLENVLSEGRLPEGGV